MNLMNGSQIVASGDSITWVAAQHGWDVDGVVYADGGMAFSLAPDTGELVQSITDATQKRLDDFAKTRNYDGILSACTYATSTVPKFAAEGQYCVNARDNTWAALYTIMAEVEAETRPMPTGYADIEPLLPVLTWPA